MPNRAKDLFLAALDLSDLVARANYLDLECGDDAALRQKVNALLAAHDAPGGGMGVATPDARSTATFGYNSTDPTTDHPARDERTGAVIAGKYTLVEEIGEGGMGSVWRAKQTEPVKRLVAVKLIKAGMDSKQVLARFEAERQALALMDHPNIAKVLDGGLHENRPYFVMELVKGKPITDYCDQNKLTPQQRLELFVSVCQAIQHAHQKGLIHRDIKPSNVLIALYDDKPVVKVIDFGVAKATGGTLTEHTIDTGFGGVVGTPQYMSPEQATFNNLDIDTRSDVYSLGVLLYELLTGTPPFSKKELEKKGLLEILRVVREEEPPRPSTKLSTADALPSLSANRGTEPKKLTGILRNELDWIVMKSLEKDRTRRYETANGFAADVNRYLSGEAVQAHPPSAAYRLTKFVRRNKGQVIAASLVLLALVAGVIGTAFGLVEARNQRDTAEFARQAEADQHAIADEQRIVAQKNAMIADEQSQAAARDRDRAEKALYFNRINLAHQYWGSNNLTQFRRILDATPPESRAWEWNYLDRLLHADLQTIPGNGQYTTSILFSRNGKRMAAFSPWANSGVIIRDLPADKTIAEITWAKTQKIFVSPAFSADGQTVALSDRSGAITLWDANTGKLIREFAKQPRPAGSLAFSPDGRWLVAAFSEFRDGERLVPLTEAPRKEELIVWNLATGKEVFHPKGYGFTALFSPDSSRMLTYKLNASLRLTPYEPETFIALFDTADWTEVAAGKLGSATSYSFSANGKRLALGGRDRRLNTSFVRVVDPVKGGEILSIVPSAVGDIDLSPDGTLLAHTRGFGSSDIVLWDLKTKRIARTLRGHTDTVNAVAFLVDGRLASCSSDNTIKFWDPTANQEFQQFSQPLSVYASPIVMAPGADALAFGQQGTTILFFGAVRGITLVGAGNSPGTGTLPGHTGGTTMISYSGDGTRLASYGRDKAIKIWDLAASREVGSYTDTDGNIQALALSPDGRWTATAHETKEVSEFRFNRGPMPSKATPIAVKVRDASTGAIRRTLVGHPDGIFRLDFSRDGRLLASADSQCVKVWDLETGALRNNLPQVNSSGDAMIFNAAGDHLIVAGGPTARMWHIASQKVVALFQGHNSARITSLALSPDDGRLATAAYSEVKLWDTRTGQEIITMPLPTNADDRTVSVGSLAWTPDGQKLRAAMSNGSIIEWNGKLKLAK